MKYSAVYGLVSLLAVASAQNFGPHWATSTMGDIRNGAGTVIYYLDSGVNNTKVPRTTGQHAVQILPCNGCTGISNPTGDPYEHGTSMAQIGRYYAPNALLKSIKIANDGSDFPLANVIKGIETAIKDTAVNGRAKIINLSLSRISVPTSHGVTYALRNATCHAYKLGIPVVYAAGNDGQNVGGSPFELFALGHAKYDPVLKGYPLFAGSTGKGDRQRPLTYAPVEHPNGKYGTSFSAAYTSAALANALSQHAGLKGNPASAFKYLAEDISENMLDTLPTDEKRFNLKRIGQAPSFTTNYLQQNPGQNALCDLSQVVLKDWMKASLSNGKSGAYNTKPPLPKPK